MLTNEQLIEFDVPEACFEQAKATVKALEEYNEGQPDIDDRCNIEETISHIADDPLYFVLEGGSDGTWSHSEYRGMFGPIHKLVIDLAAMIAGVKGMRH